MKKLNISKELPSVLGIGAGAIGAGFVYSKIPIADEKLKAAALIGLGLFAKSKKGMLGDAGVGLVAVGAQKLASTMGIGGVNDVMIGDPFVGGNPSYPQGGSNEVFQYAVPGGVETQDSPY